MILCSRCNEPFRNEAMLQVLGGLAHWECLTEQECLDQGLPAPDVGRDLGAEIEDLDEESLPF